MRIYAHHVYVCVCVYAVTYHFALSEVSWCLSENWVRDRKIAMKKMHDDGEEILCNTLWDAESTAGRNRGAKELVLINQQLKSQLTVSVVLIPSGFLALTRRCWNFSDCTVNTPAQVRFVCRSVCVWARTKKKMRCISDWAWYSKLRHMRTLHFLSFYSSFRDIQAFKDTFFS